MRARATTQSTAWFDANGVGWNDTEETLLKTPPSKSQWSPPLLPHLIFYCSLHAPSVPVQLFPTWPSTLFPPGTIAYSLLATRHAFLLSFPPIMSFLESFPDSLFFFTKDFFPNPFPHWSFTYFALLPGTHVSNLGYQGLLHGAGAQP